MHRKKNQEHNYGVKDQRDRLRRPKRPALLPIACECSGPIGHANKPKRRTKPFLQIFSEAASEWLVFELRGRVPRRKRDF
jgi:hypothetical protein